MNASPTIVRRATTSPADVDALVALRCAMWDELHPGAHADAAMRESTRVYYAEAATNRIGWLARVDAAHDRATFG